MSFAPIASVYTTKPLTKAHSLLRTHLLPVALGVALLTLFAKIAIPLQPVPITLQTVAVMVIGLLYSRSNAIQSVATYLALGALGLPVFAPVLVGPVAGMAKILGPTGGYLVGFLFAVAIMTTLRDLWLNKQSFLHQTTLCVVGTVTLFACGIGWLTHLFDFETAISAGILPMVIPAAVKIGILVSMLKLYRTIRKI